MLILVLLSVWFATVRVHFGWEHFVLDLLGISALLTILFLAEALELAYAFLSDKNPDEFGEVEGEIMEDIRKKSDFFYEAREWLAIMIIVLITLMAETDAIYVPFFGKLPNLTVPLGVLTFSIKFTVIFSLLFTTLPVIWIAQGPGKKVGLASSLKVLVSTRWVWWLVKQVGDFVEQTGLSAPATVMARWLLATKKFSPNENFGPSDQGFFLACLQRYGLALHDLSITVTVHEDGSCHVRHKFVLYLVRYPRTTYSRQIRFVGSEIESAEFLSLKGYESPVVGRKYEDIGKLLDQISEGICPDKFKNIVQERWYRNNDRVKEENKENPKEDGVRFGLTTWDPVPSKVDSACAFAAEWIGAWKQGAFKVGNDEEDWFQSRFDYPCRSYQLQILTDSGSKIFLSHILAEATLMGNPHTGEQQRLDDARKKDGGQNTLLSAVLNYPLPGTNYKYSWKVIRSE